VKVPAYPFDVYDIARLAAVADALEAG